MLSTSLLACQLKIIPGLRKTLLFHMHARRTQNEEREMSTQVSIVGEKNTLGRVRGRIQYYVPCVVAVLRKAQRWNAGQMMITVGEHYGESHSLLLDTRTKSHG